MNKSPKRTGMMDKSLRDPWKPEEDFTDFDSSSASPESHRDPFALAADAMVARLLSLHPDLPTASCQECAVAVEVPSPVWVPHIAEAWARAVTTEGDFGVPVDGDDVGGFHTYDPPSRDAKWCEFRRTGSDKLRPGQGNAGVAWALSYGLPLLGFSPDPRRYLPTDFMRVVDHEVVVPPPDGDIVATVVQEMFGEVPTVPIPDDLAVQMNESDLALARRVNQTADQYVERLVKLVQQRTKPTSSMTLDSIGGMQKAVEWGRALARDLADYRAGHIAWPEVDPGVLLYGPPGVGKTTFAKALAGSCGVPLVVGSLAEWQASGTGHLGDLLAAMRKCFAQARKQAPAILFVDEIDGFSARGAATGKNADYHTQVVNGLLEELDGVQGREGVVVVGATNHPHKLDPAIVRSGRLDRMIEIPLPSPDELERILRIHLHGDLEDVDISSAAQRAEGYTGADVAKWLRGARRRARSASSPLSLDDVLAEIDAVMPRLPERRYAVTRSMRPGTR